MTVFVVNLIVIVIVTVQMMAGQEVIIVVIMMYMGIMKLVIVGTQEIMMLIADSFLKLEK